MLRIGKKFRTFPSVETVKSRHKVEARISFETKTFVIPSKLRS